jgi:hypothetical protein
MLNSHIRSVYQVMRIRLMYISITRKLIYVFVSKLAFVQLLIALFFPGCRKVYVEDYGNIA